MESNLISIATLCSQYEIDLSFINGLRQTGLIQIIIVEQDQYIHVDQISDLEKMIRLHHELNINMEGIDVIFNLLRKEKQLREEIMSLRNRLRLYEND